MKPKVRFLLIILKEACKKFGYEWKVIDTHSNNLVQVSNGKKRFFASTTKIGMYPTNSRSLAQLVNDKAWTYKILKKNGFKVPKGGYFFLNKQYQDYRGEGKELQDAFRFAEKLRYPVFVKPNDSSLGRGAAVVYNKTQLRSHLKSIESLAPIAIIQEIIEQPEYRIFTVNGKVEFAYHRVSPQIVGDGKTSISSLIDEFNALVTKDRNKVNKGGALLKDKLKKHGFKLATILPKGKSFTVSAVANLSSGGEARDYTEKVSKKTQDWVKKLLGVIDLKVCGIDIFVKGSINDPSGFTIIELNQFPGLSAIYKLGYKDKVMQIWGKILKDYFGK